MAYHLTIRCERCDRGVHEDEAICIELTDENVCPRCYDDWTDSAAAREEALA